MEHGLYTGGFYVSKIAKECLAGFTVAIVALPLAIAFVLPRQERLRSACWIVWCDFCRFIRAVIWRDTWASNRANWTITVIATGVIATHGLEASFIAFMMAGLFQILFGVCKLGSYVRYIPYPVVSGFMNGIALIIILGEIKHVQNSFYLLC